MTNQIMVIQPYRFAHTWVFDDDAVSLVKEPFVCGIPEIIDQMTLDIPDAANGFRMLFSSSSFPSAACFDITHEEHGGAWYENEDFGTGWLCPALMLYFSKPPKTLYVACETLKKS